MDKVRVSNIFYDYLNEKMVELSDMSHSHITYKRARYVLSRFRIPEWLQMPIIKEMITCCYLERESQQFMKVGKNKVDIERIREEMISSKEKLNPNRSKRTWERRIKKK